MFKSLIGIGLAGGATGLSVGGYYLFKESEPKTLSEKFKRNKVEVLDHSEILDSHPHKSIWDSKLSEYKDSGNTKTFSDLSKENLEVSALKEKCKAYLNTDPKEISKTQGLEEMVKMWCTKTTS